MSSENTKAALQSKFPDRRRPLQPTVPRGQCVEGLSHVLRDAMLHLERGTTAGPGGGRGEFLIVLAQQWNAEQLERFSNFCMHLLHGDTPPWFSTVMGAITTVPLYKTEEMLDDQVRPIGVLHEVNRLAQGIVAAQNRLIVDEYLQPVQLGCSQAGAHKLIHCVRMS